MELGEADTSGRRRPIVKEGSEFFIDVDTVIMSIGQTPNPLIKLITSSMDTYKWDGIVVAMETTKEDAYAGGDVVNGAATVILAMGAGKNAAAAIHEKLSEILNYILCEDIKNTQLFININFRVD